MYILKHSMASALALLLITGTQAHDDTVAGLNLAQGSLASKGATKDRSVQAVQNRAAECYTEADTKNCIPEADAVYPGYINLSNRSMKDPKFTDAQTELFCKGKFAENQCKVRVICKICPDDLAKELADSFTVVTKSPFTTGICKGIKPPGDLKMSCPYNAMIIYIIAGVAGFLMVIGLIGLLLVFCVFKKKKKDGGKKPAPGATAASQAARKKATSKAGQSTMDFSKPKTTTTGAAKSSKPFFSVFKKKYNGNKSALGAPAASQPASKKAPSKTGQSTMDSSKPKSTTGGGAKSTKPKSSVRDAKSSKSTTA